MQWGKTLDISTINQNTAGTEQHFDTGGMALLGSDAQWWDSEGSILVDLDNVRCQQSLETFCMPEPGGQTERRPSSVVYCVDLYIVSSK